MALEPPEEPEAAEPVAIALVPVTAAVEVALAEEPAELVEFLYWEQKLRTAVNSFATVEFLAAQHCSH